MTRISVGMSGAVQTQFLLEQTSFGDSLHKKQKQNRTVHCIYQEPGFWKVLSCPPTGILGLCAETQGVTGWAWPKLQQCLGEKGDRPLCCGMGLSATRRSSQSPEKHLPFLRNKKSPKLKITSEFNKMSEHS